MPFQNAYLPFLQILVALFTRITSCSPALSFHAVCGFLFCLGPLGLYLAASHLTGRLGTSFFGALFYSVVSPSAILSPTIRDDVHGIWNLRRLHVLVYYGEAPHTATLALLPFAILFLSRAFSDPRLRWKIAAGVMMSATVLTNAFGAVTLALAVVCLLVTAGAPALWRNAGVLAGVSLLSYCWISPWLPPSLLGAISLNSPTSGGDYRVTIRSLIGVLTVLAGCLLLWVVLSRSRAAPGVRFFLLLALAVSGITLLGADAGMFVVPQPHRYHLSMDMFLSMAAAFTATFILDSILRRVPRKVRTAALALALLAAGRQFIHALRFADQLIRPIDITQTIEYQTAVWFDQHMQGQRAFISGSESYLFNVFTDNPQFAGGFEPLLPNYTDRVAMFTIYTGLNAGPRDAEISVAWLKAFGAQAITVSGPEGREYFKAFAHPRKFDGVLPVLWREGDDTIYGVPTRSASLAHVIPRSAVVARTPIHGLDVEPMMPYLKALDDPSYATATFEWRSLHSAQIRTTAHIGQVISVQVTYSPGWRARAGGAERPVQSDGLGLVIIDPGCNGPCEVELTYDGGKELLVTRLLSLSAVLIVLGLAVRSGRRAPPGAGQTPRREQS